MLTVNKKVLELFLQDLWKDNRNLDVVEQNGEKAIRRFADNSTTISEDLEYINCLKNKSSFNIPEIKEVTDQYIAFRYIEGTRAFNLLMDLKTLYRDENRSCYRDLGIQLLELLQNDLVEFQEVTEAEAVFTGGSCLYPAEDKMNAQYQVLTDMLPETCDFKEIVDDLARVTAVYENEVSVPFRDATPKNTIVEVPELFQQKFASYAERLDNLKKLCLSGTLSQLVRKENIYQIDFSGCKFLCPIGDDWIALNEHESTEWLTDSRRPMSPQDNVTWLCTLFVRFSRFAGRKLAYRLLNYSGYQVRFIHDDEAYYFFKLSNVCQYLRALQIIKGDQLAELMNKLYRASRYEPEKDYLLDSLCSEHQRAYYSDIYPN